MQPGAIPDTPNPATQSYSYANSGLDPFLTRSIEQVSWQTNLEARLNSFSDFGANSNQVRFDDSQVTGAVGDTFSVGTALGFGGAGLLSAQDSTKATIVQEGKLPNGDFGLRILDRSGVGVAQFGTFGDGTTDIRIAKPGYEVSSATNPQLIFSATKLTTFSIVASGSHVITKPINVASQTDNIAHGLSFTPAFLAFVNVGNFWPLPYVNSTLATSSVNGTINDVLSANVEQTNFNIELDAMSTTSYAASRSYTVVYYLLQASTNLEKLT